ncbi:MAG: cytochrome c oxidase subunit 3 [Flavobacteriaceae bacterium]|jgi:nitric oxide reductase NorE protein|nr:cytochrome c oxidase subunit 3 [Flavobacteriaceae bacterium]
MNQSVTATETQAIDHKNFFYPPGGILLWIIILLELLTFGIALIIMAYTSLSEKEIFHETAAKLNAVYGTVNTIVLLTSGYFMAICVKQFKLKNYEKSKRFLYFTQATGLLFIIVKSVEYYHKIAEGLTLGYNTFMDFYWLLTGFHLVHVIVGMVILIGIYISGKKKNHDEAALNLESGAAFWHLCDLIWLILFPVLYLIF